MVKEKLDLKKADSMSSGSVGSEQNDFEMRSKQAHDEIRVILDKYKVDIGARIDYRPESLVAVPSFVDTKGK